MTEYRLDEEDIELENSNNYDDNSSDYDPLELVQELINENLFSEIVNKGSFQLSENNQQLLDDSKYYWDINDNELYVYYYDFSLNGKKAKVTVRYQP